MTTWFSSNLGISIYPEKLYRVTLTVNSCTYLYLLIDGQKCSFLGGTPYPDLLFDLTDFKQLLKSGRRLEKPFSCPENM